MKKKDGNEMIFIVYCDDQDSSSGVSFSGIFDNVGDALNWARSEGPDYKVLQTNFGPIEWNKIDPVITNWVEE
jgi:hypothetical protein